MAKRKVNKSQEIRDYFKQNPTASAKEVVKAMAKKRIVVSLATVANVKSKSGLTKKRRGRPGRPSGKKTVRRNGKVSAASSDSFAILIEAKKLRMMAGSTQGAIDAIRTLDRLESM